MVFPLPFGLSGWVTTPVTSYPFFTSAARMAALQNPAFPYKQFSFIPLPPHCHNLHDVIHLLTRRVYIFRPDDRSHGRNARGKKTFPSYLLIHIHHPELLPLHSSGRLPDQPFQVHLSILHHQSVRLMFKDFRIDQHDRPSPISITTILFQYTHLGSCKTNTACVIHGFQHVSYQILYGVCLLFLSTGLQIFSKTESPSVLIVLIAIIFLFLYLFCWKYPLFQSPAP